MMEKRNQISCSVDTCQYNDQRACRADRVEVTLNNAVVANRPAETACKTFTPRVFR